MRSSILACLAPRRRPRETGLTVCALIFLQGGLQVNALQWLILGSTDLLYPAGLQLFPLSVEPSPFRRIMRCTKNSVAQKIECLDDSILHFIGDIKPWQSWNLPPFCELWMQYANLVSNKKIELTPIANLSQILKQAQLLHSYGDYQTASSVKSRAINILMRELNKSSKTS